MFESQDYGIKRDADFLFGKPDLTLKLLPESVTPPATVGAPGPAGQFCRFHVSPLGFLCDFQVAGVDFFCPT